MKKLTQFTLLLMAAGALWAADGTFTGEIMDKQCAEMGSHDAMMKSEGAKNAKECALACAKDGGGFALYDSQSKKVYPIADAGKVRDYAGERVQITGDYDQNADVLHVKSVSRAQ
ncbi:MAG TPA: hypothetical protein VFA04_05450 [Bryobacteraceae bacterium]|nr:hypothetical protein [Bryobacteraceae bacterium]